jgi:hypothetical protein
MVEGVSAFWICVIKSLMACQDDFAIKYKVEDVKHVDCIYVVEFIIIIINALI